MTKFEDLVNLLRALKKSGKMAVSPLARTRMDAASINYPAAFEAIDIGDAYPCREFDRVKFMTPDMIVFVALGHDYDDVTMPFGFIVSAFKNRCVV